MFTYNILMNLYQSLINSGSVKFVLSVALKERLKSLYFDIVQLVFGLMERSGGVSEHPQGIMNIHSKFHQKVTDKNEVLKTVKSTMSRICHYSKFAPPSQRKDLFYFITFFRASFLLRVFFLGQHSETSRTQQHNKKRQRAAGSLQIQTPPHTSIGS